MSPIVCHISRRTLAPKDAHRGNSLRRHLFSFIQLQYPDFGEDSYISTNELNKYRRLYLENLVKQESGEINRLESAVIEAIDHNHLLADNITPMRSEPLTLGQRLADRIASFGGSWTFILCFFSFLVVWMLFNAWWLHNRGFDPYPFILLNLILSCLAAIQAPIIMMSQNRQEEKDRQRSEYDYQINLKAELEIRLLHEKIDHLLIHQHRRLLEIQEIQTDYLEDILRQGASPKPSSQA